MIGAEILIPIAAAGLGIAYAVALQYGLLNRALRKRPLPFLAFSGDRYEREPPHECFLGAFHSAVEAQEACRCVMEVSPGHEGHIYSVKTGQWTCAETGEKLK